MEKAWNKSCLSCSLLLTQMKETSSDSYRQYNRILQTLMELERKGVLELFAVPQLRSHLFYRSLYSRNTGISQGGEFASRKSGHQALGTIWNIFFRSSIELSALKK